MKIKKIICVLISFSLLLATFAQAESQINGISFVLSDNDGKLQLTTSMIPVQFFTIDLPEGLESQDIFTLINPGILPVLIDCFTKTIIDKSSKESAEIQQGFFSGDCFDHASEKTVIKLKKEETEVLLTDLFGKIRENEIEADTTASLERILRLLLRQINTFNATTIISSYDGGRYLTLSINEGQKTVLTISADLSEKGVYRVVTGRGAGDAVYYDEIVCKQNGLETDYILSLFRTIAPTFRMVYEQDCVQFSELRFEKTKNRGYKFKGEISSVLFPATVRITGGRIAEENRVYADIDTGDQTKKITEALMAILLEFVLP